jgi:hypothetical protein
MEPAVGSARHYVGEGAAAVDPELPTRAGFRGRHDGVIRLPSLFVVSPVRAVEVVANKEPG